ncbi:MAG: S1 RNA-binding domain-containing protein [Planctomycetota bacterium]
MRRPSDPPPPARDHGPHTLRVWEGVVVGRNGDDVFVELGERMQGVISAREFAAEPRVGEIHEFTLRGQEESLWVLARREAKSLSTWEDMEVGSLVHARVVRPRPGGLEVKIGPLHAFLPRSQTGLPREEKPAVLVGKTLACEVIEIDAERQQVVVSRQLVLQRERASERERRVAGLKAGQVVNGRVTRIEEYGVFLRFGAGLEGLVHVSNLAHERVGHPGERVKIGDRLDAKVLYVNKSGKRIALGVKQLGENPWRDFAASHAAGDLLAGEVVRTFEFGAFVRVAPGIEGLVPRSEMGLPPDRPVRRALAVGQPVSVRLRAVDAEGERLSLSLLHRDGRPIAPEEAEERQAFAAREEAGEGAAPARLGPLLARALHRGPGGEEEPGK